jgi:hypothetical protein
MNNYTVNTLSQFDLEYFDEKYFIKIGVDDLREPVPHIIIYEVFNKEENKSEELSKEVKLGILKRICTYLKSEGYIKIYTEEFGYIDV